VSNYVGDPRVRRNADGTVTIPGGERGDWLVARNADGRWMASHPAQGNLRDRVDGDYSAQYASCDEVLAQLLAPATAPV
jgi:hypothetical protein